MVLNWIFLTVFFNFVSNIFVSHSYLVISTLGFLLERHAALIKNLNVHEIATQFITCVSASESVSAHFGFKLDLHIHLASF